MRLSKCVKYFDSKCVKIDARLCHRGKALDYSPGLQITGSWFRGKTLDYIPLDDGPGVRHWITYLLCNVRTDSNLT